MSYIYMPPYDGGGYPVPTLFTLFIDEAGELKIPDTKLDRFAKAKNEDWIKAFAWYNKYFNSSKYKLGMNCMGCYPKVYNKLIHYKKIYNSIQKEVK